MKLLVCLALYRVREQYFSLLIQSLSLPNSYLSHSLSFSLRPSLHGCQSNWSVYVEDVFTILQVAQHMNTFRARNALLSTVSRSGDSICMNAYTSITHREFFSPYSYPFTYNYTIYAHTQCMLHTTSDGSVSLSFWSTD